MLRLWSEVLDEEHIEIRGVARHVRTGNRCSIRDWSALQAFLTKQINALSSDVTDPDGESGRSNESQKQ